MSWEIFNRFFNSKLFQYYSIQTKSFIGFCDHYISNVMLNNIFHQFYSIYSIIFAMNLKIKLFLTQLCVSIIIFVRNILTKIVNKIEISLNRVKTLINNRFTIGINLEIFKKHTFSLVETLK